MTNDFFLYKGIWMNEHYPHLSKLINKEMVHSYLREGGYLLRNIYDWDCQQKTSFWFIIKDTYGGLEELSSKVRNQVRRSLKTYDIKMVDLNHFLQVAYPIYLSAMNGYRVSGKVIDEQSFNRNIQTKIAGGNIDLWCVFEKDNQKAVAFSINTRYNDYCAYNTMKADPYYLKNSTYPYYGLLYEMNRFYLEELKLKYVSDGARSITEHSNIQPFLEEKFNFRKAYCHIQIEYKWWLKIVVFILYPFRKWIPLINIKALLNMEAINRGVY